MTDKLLIDRELLPCPFCGGTDLHSEPWCVMPDNYHASLVSCADCEFEGPSSLTLTEPDGCWMSDEESAIAEGIKAWNRRAAPRQPEGDGLEVVMPGRKQRPYGFTHMPSHYEGWNACLDEFARLNGKEVGRG